MEMAAFCQLACVVLFGAAWVFYGPEVAQPWLAASFVIMALRHRS